MACQLCGSRCQGDRCAMCAQIDADEARHGDVVPAPDSNEDNQDEEDDADVEADDPHQESTDDQEARAEWTVDQQGLDGSRHEGQATLGGGVAKDPAGGGR